MLTHFDVHAVQDFLSFPLPRIPHSSCRPCICTLGTAWQGAHARRKRSHTASTLAPLQKQQIGAETGKIIFNDVTCRYCFLMEKNGIGIYKLQSFTHVSDKYWESDKSRKAGSSVLSAASWKTTSKTVLVKKKQHFCSVPSVLTYFVLLTPVRPSGSLMMLLPFTP